jgi:hypothetical protein
VDWNWTADAAVLAKVEMDRKLSMIKAWEESEKSKAQNKYVGSAQQLHSAALLV